MNFKINHIQHIGIPVTNMEVSEAFYNQLGFVNSMSSEFFHKAEKGRVKMMQRDDMILEIYQMPESELIEIRTRKNGHIDHIAFDVENIDEVFELLKGEGFNIQEEAPVFLPFWKNGCKYFNIIGPDGERIEFNQIL
jgi:lactoylglutathione lyase